jgi:transmembrane 9 superfamily protein 2/4
VVVSENLGEILRGDRIENSPYNLTMKVAESGKALCAIDPLTKDQAELLAKRIQQRYVTFIYLVI